MNQPFIFQGVNEKEKNGYVSSGWWTKSFRTFFSAVFFWDYLRYFAAKASDLYNVSFKVTEFIFKVMMINKSHDYRTPWYTVWCTCVPFWCNKTNSWSHDASSPNLLITKETQTDWNNTPLKINMEHNNESWEHDFPFQFMWFLGYMLIFQSVALYDHLSREGWNLYRNKSIPSTYTLKPLPFVQRLSRSIHHIGDKHSSHL